MSHVKRKFAFYKCKNKDAVQLCSDQRLCFRYDGHSRINDDEFISRKVLLDSVLFVMTNEDTDITYSCLKFCAFIIARFDAQAPG